MMRASAKWAKNVASSFDFCLSFSFTFLPFFSFPFSFSLVFFGPLFRLIICYLLLVDLSYAHRHHVEVYRAPRAVGDHLTHTITVSKTPSQARENLIESFYRPNRRVSPLHRKLSDFTIHPHRQICIWIWLYFGSRKDRTWSMASNLVHGVNAMQ